MDEKWQTLRSDSLLKDRWIDLRADHCRTPAGQDVSAYYVLSYPEWVNIVAVTGEGHLVLVRQYRQAAGQSFLEIPGGAADPGDTDFEQAARRELLEETGYTAERFERVISLYPNPAIHTNRVHTCLAQNAMLTADQSLDPGEEGLKVHLLPVRRARRIAPGTSRTGHARCFRAAGLGRCGTSGVKGCVWELALINAEQEAWRQTMMTVPPSPSADMEARADFEAA